MAVVNPDDWSLRADRAETHQVHETTPGLKVIMILSRSGRWSALGADDQTIGRHSERSAVVE